MAKRTSRTKSSDQAAAASPKRPSRPSRAKAPADVIAAPVSASDTAGAMATEMASSKAQLAAQRVEAPESKRSKAGVSMSSEPSEADIRLRAYHKFLHRHGGAGSDWDDWFAAEKELRRTSGQEKRQLS